MQKIEALSLKWSRIDKQRIQSHNHHQNMAEIGRNRGYVSDKNTAPLSPSSDAEAAGSPLVRRPYDADLHLAIGNLKQFDATKNGAPGALPCCDFLSTTGEIIQGGALLDVWGPLWFVVAREVLPILVPELGEAFCDAMNAADIQAIMLRHVIWCASICVHLLFHT